MPKTAAQLDREIAAVLASRPRPGRTEPISRLVEYARDGKQAQIVAVRAALAKSPAIVLTPARGDQTLVIQSVEPYDTAAGSLRASYFGPDGPIGHTTRPTMDALILEIVAMRQPLVARAVDDDEVMAWTSTPEFTRGAEAAARAMAANERKR